ncbi:MAG TPA: glycosyltransferase family 2 protein [Blastocatellia bacterium]
MTVWIFWSIALVWLATLGYNLVCIKRAPWIPRNREIDFETTALRFTEDNAPSVSVLVPARNEAGRVLSTSISSMLGQDYPNYEVIAVDDRSTDKTGEVLAGIAATSPRLKVIRGKEPPEGWHGKPWALYQARQAASGDWILATDADVIFNRDAITQAVSVAVREAFDAVSIIPAISSKSTWMNIVMPVAGWSIMALYPYWRVNNPKSPVALGAGGFFLIKAIALGQAGGYSAIRGEIIDDLATARLLKGAGFRLNLSAGPTLLTTPMYSGLRELFHGFAKNAYAGSGGSPVKSVFFSLANLSFTVAPILTVVVWLIAAIFGSTAPTSILWSALAAWLAMTFSFAPVYRQARAPVYYALLAFAGHLVMISILLSSTWRIISGRGVTWKSRNLYAPAGEQAAPEANSAGGAGSE